MLKKTILEKINSMSSTTMIVKNQSVLLGTFPLNFWHQLTTVRFCQMDHSYFFNYCKNSLIVYFSMLNIFEIKVMFSLR